MPLVVRKDPNAGGNDADIQAQTAMLRDLQKDFEAAGEIVNTIEVVRSQLGNLIRLTASVSQREARGKEPWRVSCSMTAYMSATHSG